MPVPLRYSVNFAVLQVAITDSDTKERKALLLVWEDMTLLLCLYHFSKACTNHMVKMMGSGGSAQEVLLRNQGKTFIRQFLARYVFVVACRNSPLFRGRDTLARDLDVWHRLLLLPLFLLSSAKNSKTEAEIESLYQKAVTWMEVCSPPGHTASVGLVLLDDV